MSEHKGYKEEIAPSGERLLCFRVRINGKWEMRKIPLAEISVQAIRRDKNFAAHFKKLLDSTTN